MSASLAELRLLLDISESISAAADHASAVEDVVSTIACAAGWRRGTAWLGEDPGVLVCSQRDGARDELAVRALVTQAPAWAADACSVAFPITSGARPYGVLVLAADSPVEQDGGWTAIVAVACSQLGLWLARKRAEDELRERTRSLERMNRQLDEFASVASHDLQEPLRKVRAFASRLRERFAAALDDAGRDYFERLDNAAVRMQRLMDDLLAFARLAKLEAHGRVELEGLTREVLRDLDLERSGATVELGELPAVRGDAAQLRQLMQNLLANSLKFIRPGTVPHICVTASTQQAVATIMVTDNGIGFDNKHAERIFGMLERLHARTAYAGSGMGLAICRRIVEAHGGTIAARGVPDGGATFVFTLPLAYDLEDNR